MLMLRTGRNPSGSAIPTISLGRLSMIPWVHLDTATMPGGGRELRLMRRGDEYSIMSGSITLMNSRISSSETALGELACDRLGGRRNCRILIGGYGMGFTLRAALAGLGADARILVAELVPAVLKWARGPMAELTAGCLSDPRVSIRETDVGGLIASARASFDAILLDVDNGPDGFSRGANDGLYSLRGLKAARNALRPNGLLAVWSAAPDIEFASRLGRAGFAVEEIKVRANKGRGGRHVIWAATNKAGGADALKNRQFES
jgi:spermidine synthase